MAPSSRRPRSSTAVEDAKPGTSSSSSFKTDDSAAVVAAGSVDEAVKKVKEQLDEIGKKSTQSDKDKARRRRWNGLQRAREHRQEDKDAKSSGDKVKTEKTSGRSSSDRSKTTRSSAPRTKAEIEKATAKVKELADELQSKQKELMEARTKLAKLQGQTRTPTVTGRANVDRRTERGPSRRWVGWA